MILTYSSTNREVTPQGHLVDFKSLDPACCGGAGSRWYCHRMGLWYLVWCVMWVGVCVRLCQCRCVSRVGMEGGGNVEHVGDTAGGHGGGGTRRGDTAVAGHGGARSAQNETNLSCCFFSPPRSSGLIKPAGRTGRSIYPQLRRPSPFRVLAASLCTCWPGRGESCVERGACWRAVG